MLWTAYTLSYQPNWLQHFSCPAAHCQHRHPLAHLAPLPLPSSSNVFKHVNTSAASLQLHHRVPAGARRAENNRPLRLVARQATRPRLGQPPALQGCLQRSGRPRRAPRPRPVAVRRAGRGCGRERDRGACAGFGPPARARAHVSRPGRRPGAPGGRPAQVLRGATRRDGGARWPAAGAARAAGSRRGFY